MSSFSYYTIEKPALGFYKEKGSKFHAFAFPVESEVEIKTNLDQLRKEYFDARHHCYAWMLGPDKMKFRAVDDGEPNHSAGDPILGQIRSRDITNVLVVVVRYFGGIKLGVGGLITAYKSSAKDALDHAVIIEKEIEETFSLSFNYTATPEVMRLIKEYHLKILDQRFSSECEMDLSVMLKHKQMFKERITLLNALGITLQLK